MAPVDVELPDEAPVKPPRPRNRSLSINRAEARLFDNPRETNLMLVHSASTAVVPDSRPDIARKPLGRTAHRQAGDRSVDPG